jgi:hypothetical protein
VARTGNRSVVDGHMLFPVFILIVVLGCNIILSCCMLSYEGGIELIGIPSNSRLVDLIEHHSLLLSCLAPVCSIRIISRYSLLV